MAAYEGDEQGMSREQMLAKLFGGPDPGKKKRPSSGGGGGGFPHETVVGVSQVGDELLFQHANGSVTRIPFSSPGGGVNPDDIRQETTDADYFNSPTSFQTAANAIKNGTCRVVTVGDSLMFGWQAGASNSPISYLSKRLRAMLPSTVFTFIDRSIPGGRLENFLDTNYQPADSFAIGTAAAAGTPGRDQWTTDEEEHSFRWPEGAANLTADAWQTVVQNDAPDILVFGLGFNDINAGAASIKTVRDRLTSFMALFDSWDKVPSIVLATSHDGNPDLVALSQLTQDSIRGLHNLIRGFSRTYATGLYDPHRAFSRHVHGIDPLTPKFDTERYLDGLNSSSQWAEEYTVSPTGSVVTNYGQPTVALDSTGRHAGAAFGIYARKVGCSALNASFNIRKLATDNDNFYLVFNAPTADSESKFHTNKMQLRFRNLAGVGKVEWMMDAVILQTLDTAAWPTVDAAGTDVVVTYDGRQIRVWVGANTDPNAPDMTCLLASHAFGYPAVAYGNGVGAPAVKVVDFVLQIGADSLERVADTTIDEFFGDGPVGGYFTDLKPEGGDALLHPSSVGYQLMYDAPLTPVLDALYQQVGTQRAIVSRTSSFSVAPNLSNCQVNCGNVDPTALVVTLPGPNQNVRLYPGFECDIVRGNTGLVTIAAADANSVITGEPGAQVLSVRYSRVRVRLSAVGANYIWSLIHSNPTKQDIAGSQGLYLGCHWDGTNFIADADTAVIYAQSSVVDRANIFVNTGLVVGNSFTPTVRFAVDGNGNIFGTALHNNATAPTGATNHYIASGTYTPTLTNTTNVAASSIANGDFQWMRVGNVVTVSGLVTIDPTAAGNTLLGLSLPLASDLAAVGDLSGTGCAAAQTAADGASLAIFGDAVNNRASLRWQTVGIASMIWSVQFTYVIK